MLVIFFLLHLISYTHSSCPIGSIQGNNPDECYKFYSVPTNWVAAEQWCVGQNGHLSSILNAFENNFIENLLQSIADGVNTVWIGGNTISNRTGIWMWSDGSWLSYINWAYDQPTGNQNMCTSFNTTAGTWYSQSCTSINYPYLCKVMSGNSTGNSTQGTTSGSTWTTSPTGPSKICQNGYIYFSGTQMCYKFYPATNLTFQMAENTCMNDGGHLASIHSNEENFFISNSTSNYLAQERNIWIGIYFNNTNNIWTWTDGSIVDYANWGYERPFPGDGCGMIVNSQWTNNCTVSSSCNWFGLWDSQSVYDCTLTNSNILYAVCKMASSE